VALNQTPIKILEKFFKIRGNRNLQTADVSADKNPGQ